jgi:hypothetical protein
LLVVTSFCLSFLATHLFSKRLSFLATHLFSKRLSFLGTHLFSKRLSFLGTHLFSKRLSFFGTHLFSNGSQVVCLEMDRRDEYDEVVRKLARALTTDRVKLGLSAVDPMRLQLGLVEATDTEALIPLAPIEYAKHKDGGHGHRLADMLGLNLMQRNSSALRQAAGLYFRILPCDIRALESAAGLPSLHRR